ncbi:alpha/beta fold hydrolase [Kribbella sp. DT2]|uniref:alpha/beta fold hydrolase n=1 Tax=Kribbella sp. DT2 TaxID=3393427 RepID=UPI003CF57B56
MSNLQKSCVVDGIQLKHRYVPGDGPCTVFVSGLGESGEVWDGVIEHLPAGLSTFVYDRAGCGSSGPVDAATAVGDAQPIQWGAEQLFKLLNTVGVPKPWVLVGHSMGGLIVDAFARLWPEQVTGLALVDASDPVLHTALDNDKLVLVDGRDGEGWRISVPATLDNFEPGPQRQIETVVIGSAVWRWLPVKKAAEYRPLTLVEMDQWWQRHQLNLAKRWTGHLVVPHFAGHHVHKDSPELVAYVAQCLAAAERGAIQLDQAALIQHGGTARVSVTNGEFTEWGPTGPRSDAD